MARQERSPRLHRGQGQGGGASASLILRRPRRSRPTCEADSRAPSSCSQIEEQVSSAFKALDKQLYLLHYKSLGAAGAAPNPLAYFKGLLNTGSSATPFYGEVTEAGIRKVGPKGEWVLQIGIEDELIPGARTRLGRKGEDIVGRKRSTEALLEEGRQELIGAVTDTTGTDSLTQAYDETTNNLDEAVDSERRKALKVAKRRAREEARREGWRSEAFDL